MGLVRSVRVQTTKAYVKGGGVTPFIHNRGGLLKVKEPPVPFNRWLDGRQSRSGRFWRELGKIRKLRSKYPVSGRKFEIETSER
jgi:hypothetical protein